MVRCYNCYCETNACYNYEGKRKPKYCAKHKLKGMINVKSSHCIHPNCKRQSIYNIEGEKARYCGEHKTNDMINVKRVSKPKTCIHTNCKKYPRFNTINNTIGLYCCQHKLPNMYDVVSRMCIHDSCMKIPKFNTKSKSYGIYCFEHKLKNMINVVERPCTTPLCSTLGLKKYDGHCLYCYVHLFPFSPLTRNFKTKEASVVEFVKNSFPNYSWITDKRIQDGCSKRRPDIFLDLGDQVLIVEVDENQHVNYDCSCENKRLMELSQDVGHRPIVFIRFNPDSYINDENKIPSCWCINKEGLCVIKNSSDWDQRLEALKQQIEYWIKHQTTKMVEIIQLFY